MKTHTYNTPLFHLSFLMSLLICIPSFCANEQTDKQKLSALMKTSYTEFRNMDHGEAKSAKQMLQAHSTNTKEAFLNEPLLFGISRGTISQGLFWSGLSLLAGGAGYDDTTLYFANQEEITSGLREADTCRATDGDLIADWPHFLIGSTLALALGALADRIAQHPAERQLKALKEAQGKKS